MGVLTVRNRAQQILFEGELQGQISDGMWENSRPHDHWKVWCNAEITIAETESEVGRNFWAQRDTYNFTSRDLLKIVGDRMLESVQAEIPQYTHVQMIEDLNDLKQLIKIQRAPTSAEIRAVKLREEAHAKAKAAHDARVAAIATRASQALGSYVSPYNSRATITWDALERLLDALEK